MSGSRFRTRTHALDALETFPNRFGDFYFSMKIMIFQDFQEIHDFGHFQSIQGGRLLLAPWRPEELERRRDRSVGSP